MNGIVLPGTPIAVDFWNIRKCPHVRLFFLTHLHGDHTSGLTSSWSRPIYCSPLTKKLLILQLEVAADLVHELEVNASHMVALGAEESVTVSVVEANHCPGAVMFLFQGYFGTVLCTGDFRYTPEMFVDTPLSLAGVIDTVYLDNTYCQPGCHFPSRQEATSHIEALIASRPGYDVYIGVRNLGKEELLVDLARRFDTWIVVSPRHWKMLQALDLPDVFSTDPDAGFIRAVPLMQINGRSMERWSRRERPLLAVLPTALYTAIGGQPFINRKDIHVVPYSDHSSYAELHCFVSRLQARRVLPIVGAKARGVFGISLAVRADMTCFQPYLYLPDGGEGGGCEAQDRAGVGVRARGWLAAIPASVKILMTEAVEQASRGISDGGARANSGGRCGEATGGHTGRKPLFHPRRLPPGRGVVFTSQDSPPRTPDAPLVPENVGGGIDRKESSNDQDDLDLGDVKELHQLEPRTSSSGKLCGGRGLDQGGGDPGLTDTQGQHLALVTDLETGVRGDVDTAGEDAQPRDGVSQDGRPRGPGSSRDTGTTNPERPRGPGSSRDTGITSPERPPGPGSSRDTGTTSLERPRGPGSSRDTGTTSSERPRGPGSSRDTGTTSPERPRGPGSSSDAMTTENEDVPPPATRWDSVPDPFDSQAPNQAAGSSQGTRRRRRRKVHSDVEVVYVLDTEDSPAVELREEDGDNREPTSDALSCQDHAQHPGVRLQLDDVTSGFLRLRPTPDQTVLREMQRRRRGKRPVTSSSDEASDKSQSTLFNCWKSLRRTVAGDPPYDKCETRAKHHSPKGPSFKSLPSAPEGTSGRALYGGRSPSPPPASRISSDPGTSASPLPGHDRARYAVRQSPSPSPLSGVSSRPLTHPPPLPGHDRARYAASQSPSPSPLSGVSSRPLTHPPPLPGHDRARYAASQSPSPSPLSGVSSRPLTHPPPLPGHDRARYGGHLCLKRRRLAVAVVPINTASRASSSGSLCIKPIKRRQDKATARRSRIHVV